MPNKKSPSQTVHLVLTEGQDAELQPYLARDALFGLDQLLAGQPIGEAIAVERVGAIVRLISQALHGVRLP